MPSAARAPAGAPPLAAPRSREIAPPRPPRAVRRSAGFTLIEVMVVLVIMGVMATGISLGIDSLRGRDADQALKRLRLVLEASADRASVRASRSTVVLCRPQRRLSSASERCDSPSAKASSSCSARVTAMTPSPDFSADWVGLLMVQCVSFCETALYGLKRLPTVASSGRGFRPHASEHASKRPTGDNR